MKKIAAILLMGIYIACNNPATEPVQPELPVLKISANNRFFQTADGKPFFWLGDTGWLLFVKCNRQEAIQYLQTRKEQGFNVVQVMVIHDLKKSLNRYGDSAFLYNNIEDPLVTPGKDTADAQQYDYWDHIEFIIDEAAKRGIYMALVPVWGSNLKASQLTPEQSAGYGAFLANRFKNKSNIIWVNGGDIRGGEAFPFWQILGNTIRQNDSAHLMTFHPRGRYSSTEWFHNEPWLDFNMVQSGHRTYEQDTSAADKNHYGEDNWKYIQHDYNLIPVKPVLDGEPSYENIPHGLHDSLQPRWTAADLRRYEYWSVFAGGAGFTYGENAVMQFHRFGDADANYGVNQEWISSVLSPGAQQMHILKDLLLSKNYFDRVPAQEIIKENTRDRYNYLAATKGNNYALVYTYTGRNFSINPSRLGFTVSKASWFKPATGETTAIENINNFQFDPPGEPGAGNDWLLILE